MVAVSSIPRVRAFTTADQYPRAEELSKLKHALAIFSMHAFEARARGRLIVGKKLEVPSSLTSLSQSESSQR
jgi:hypothetical protein